MKILNGLVILSALFLASCVDIQEFTIQRNGNIENYVVELSAASGASQLKVHNGPKRCNNGKEGCMEFGLDKVGTVRFQFKGNQRFRDCNTNPKANWVITKIQLSATGDAATDKATFGAAPPPWLVSAFPGIDETNGVIFDSDYKAASSAATIINLNDNPAADPKDIYYQVTATRCSDGVTTIDIDPKIRNLGK